MDRPGGADAGPRRLWIRDLCAASARSAGLRRARRACRRVDSGPVRSPGAIGRAAQAQSLTMPPAISAVARFSGASMRLSSSSSGTTAALAMMFTAATA